MRDDVLFHPAPVVGMPLREAHSWRSECLASCVPLQIGQATVCGCDMREHWPEVFSQVFRSIGIGSIPSARNKSEARMIFDHA